MTLFRPAWTLSKKNLLIVLRRHPFSTILRAFLFPLGLMLFLSYAKHIFIPQSTFGMGSPRPIRTLSKGLAASRGGRNTLALVHNGLTGGDIERVMDELEAEVRLVPGKQLLRLPDEAALLRACPSSLRAATNCYGGVIFASSPSEGSGGIWNYTMRADGNFGTAVNVQSDNNAAEIYLLPLQRAIDVAIARINTTIDQSALPSTVYQYPFTTETQEQREVWLRTTFARSIVQVLAVAFFGAMVGITYHVTGLMATERELGMSQLIEGMLSIGSAQQSYTDVNSHDAQFSTVASTGGSSSQLPRCL